jgi:hypothetical protein
MGGGGLVDRALRFDLLGRDKTLGRTLGKSGRDFKGLGTTALKVGSIIGTAFAGLAIGGFLKDAIAEARDAQKVSRQTAAVIKATGGVAKVTAKDIDRLSNSLMRKVGVDDEVIATGLNMMLTFKGVRNEAGKGNDIFNQSAAAALDMTAAMNKGVITQEGLQSSTIRLGRALNDPIKGMTALTRVGVTFTQKQKDQIKALVEAGDKMGAQKIILAELKSEFGGAAAAAADPWQRFSVLMGNIKERIGTVLLPALTGVFGFLTSTLIPGIERFARRVKEAVGPAVSTLTDDIQAKFDDFKINFATFRDNLVTGVKKLGQPVVDAIGVALKTGDWKPIGTALGDALKQVIGDGVSLFSKVFSGVDWVNVGKAIGAHAFGFAVGFVSALGSDIIKVAREHPIDLVIFLGSILAVGKLGGVISKLLGKIPFLRAFAPLFEGLSRLTGPVNKAIGAVVSFIGKAFREGLERVFPSVAKILRGRIGDMLAWLSLRREAFLKAGGRLIRGLAVGIGEQIGLVIRNIGQVIAAITRPFINSARWLIRPGIEAISGLVRGIRSVFGSVSNAVGGVISRATSPFRRAGGWLIVAGRDLVAGLRRGISAAIGSVGSVLRSLKDAIVGGLKRLFGIGSPSKVMAGIGGHLVAGLVKGLVTNFGSLKAIVKSIGGGVIEWLGDVLGFLTGGPAVARGSYGSNRNTLRAVARSYGWDTGAQWIALANLISGESGFNNTAQNPTSSAFGMGQFLDSTWATVGMKKTADAWAQSVGIMRYIAKNYGTPTAAYGAWLGRSPHWYGEGGIFKKPTIIGVGERGPEAVVPLGRTGRPEPVGAATGTTINVNLDLRGSTFTGPPSKFVNEIAPKMRAAIRDVQRRSGVAPAAQLK